MGIGLALAGIMNKTALLSFSLLSVVAVGCAAPAVQSTESDDAEASADLTAASDPVLLANAKTYVEHISGAEGTYWNDTSPLQTIPYADLPSNIAKSVARDNPNPKAEWAAVAVKTTVLNAKGKAKTIYIVIDGIDDEGEDFTVYTSGGKQIAQADDYRGLEWN
jgi:hypothetical protein